MARIGIELNLFQILTKNGDVPVNTKTLAEQTGVDPVLMGLSLILRMPKQIRVAHISQVGS
jgi:hypothetical protein